MSHTSELAKFAAELTLDDIPEDVRRLARVSLMDSIGLILAGYAFLEQETESELGRYLDTLGAGPNGHRISGL